MAEAPIIVVWSWEARDPARRRGWRLLRWKMDEGDATAWAAANRTEIRKVAGSEEERLPLQGWFQPHPSDGTGR